MQPEHLTAIAMQVHQGVAAAGSITAQGGFCCMLILFYLLKGVLFVHDRKEHI
jgi:hypothetical protein